MNGQTLPQDQIKYMIIIFGGDFLQLIMVREVKGAEKEHTETLPLGL